MAPESPFYTRWKHDTAAPPVVRSLRTTGPLRSHGPGPAPDPERPRQFHVPNTRRAYNQAWRRFEAWAASRGRGHSLPASPDLVAAFLAELAEAEAGKSVATLRLTKSALAAVHRSTGHQDPTDN